MASLNSGVDSSFGWSIQLFTKDGAGKYQPSSDYLRSVVQTIASDRDAGNGWGFGNGQEYRYNDTFRFVHTSNNQENNLTKYQIFVSQNDGKSFPTQMMLQVGNASLMGVETTIGNSTGYIFDLSSTGLHDINGELKTSSVNSYLSSGNHIGVRTFTIQPFWKGNNMGQESIVISFGPQYYDPQIASKIYTSDVNTLKGKTSLEAGRFDSFDIDGVKYQVKVGAIADYMLNQDTLDDLNIVVNGRGGEPWVDGNEVILSQNIIYRPASNASANNDDWKMFTLGFNHKIAVTGQSQQKPDATKPADDYMYEGALISGTNIEKEMRGNDFQKFFGGLLDIYSTDDTSGISAEISGITFNDNPSRGMGAVTANGYYPAVNEEYWHNYQSASGKPDYWSRLYAAITSARDNTKNIFNPNRGATNTKVKIWDNQILSWNTASDGIESLSPNLLSAKNFYKVNDDALKLLSRNQQFSENTIHLGPDGAAISFGYGFNNGPVMNTNVDGAYIHRIVQPNTNPAPKYSGVVADWMYWNKNLVDPENAANAGIITPRLSNIYIPSMANADKINANVMSRSGTVSAVVHNDRHYFEDAYEGNLENWYVPGQHYKAGGYRIGWENNLPAADFYYVYPRFNGPNDFDMSEGRNRFIKTLGGPETYSLVMNKTTQDDKKTEANVYQYVDISPVTFTSSSERSSNWVDSSSGISIFNLADDEFSIVLSNSIGPSNRNFELLGGNQSGKVLRVNASNLSEASINLSQASNYKTVLAAAPAILDLELSGLYLDCGSGHDEVTGSGFNDFLRGGDGDDVISAGSGDDICRVGRGNDTLYLGDGNDILFLTADQLDRQHTNQIKDFSLKEDRILIREDLSEYVEISYQNKSFSIELRSPWATGITTFEFGSDISGIDIGFG